MTSEDKVKREHPWAHASYNGMWHIFDPVQGKNLSGRKLHRSWAWADAWRRIAAAREAEKEEKS